MDIGIIDIAIYSITILLIVLLGALLMQLRKVLAMKSRMEKFLKDLRSLNEGARTGSLSPDSSSSTAKRKSVRHVCEFCKSRVTYVNHDSDDLFTFACRRDQHPVKLEDTCEHFVKDLHNSTI
jgi:hypothetical protein